MQAFFHFMSKISHKGTNLQMAFESIWICPTSNIILSLLLFSFYFQILCIGFCANKQLLQSAMLNTKTPLVHINPSCWWQGFNEGINGASLYPLSPSKPHSSTLPIFITLVTSTSCGAVASQNIQPICSEAASPPMFLDDSYEWYEKPLDLVFLQRHNTKSVLSQKLWQVSISHLSLWKPWDSQDFDNGKICLVTHPFDWGYMFL